MRVFVRYDPLINGEKQDSILYQLQKIFACLQIGKQPYATTSDLTKSFQWNESESYQQQDVQEFMRVLFDAVEQSFEINSIFGVIENLYMGEYESYIKCHACNYQSKNNAKFCDLQLAIKNEFGATPAEKEPVDSIERALYRYMLPDLLEGDNAYRCPGCNNLVTASKGIRLKRLPKILTLQLQRFTLDMNTFYRKKLNDRVSFPVYLNMNHFLDEEKLQDEKMVEELIKSNPLDEVKPSKFKQDAARQARANAK